MDWAEANNKLNEAQFGFRGGRRTTDPIFILSTAIQAHKKKRKPLYACFVDFAKAFDSVKHKLLWNKLAGMGVSTKILNLLQSMYGKASCRVTANNTLSSSFPCRKGVRQGCNLSPLLFCLYISDLESYLEINSPGHVTLENLKVQLLLFADDLVLLADSEQGLQNSMNRLDEFCNIWDMKINIQKTNVVILILTNLGTIQCPFSK